MFDTPPDPAPTRLVALLSEMVPASGIFDTLLEGVTVARAERTFVKAPVLYEPKLMFICQGRKRGFFGEQILVFDAHRYLVAAVPLPFDCETEASAERPLLAIGITIDLASVAELILALDSLSPRSPVPPLGIATAPMDLGMEDALYRLLRCLRSPVEARLLGPGIVREILYRMLTGEQGAAIAGALVHHSQCGRIGRALRRIHAEYAADLDVTRLAEEAGMSLAAFHSHFKQVTRTSPIQYLKTTRLHKARLLMVHEGLSASTASGRVGYESASQFSREFKRFFGSTPREEAERMKSVLVPAAPASPYVSVQVQ
ncbi:MAG: AraC family transcriptional regulator [Stagnimonas sp.]|nr:AraC family transcriptional regulator [Stagnimonas sp.]